MTLKSIKYLSFLESIYLPHFCHLFVFVFFNVGFNFFALFLWFNVLGQEPLQELLLRVLCNLVIVVAFVVGIKMYLSLTLLNSQYLIVNSPPLPFRIFT